jgi:hypothetical protein
MENESASKVSLKVNIYFRHYGTSECHYHLSPRACLLTQLANCPAIFKISSATCKKSGISKELKELRRKCCPYT